MLKSPKNDDLFAGGAFSVDKTPVRLHNIFMVPKFRGHTVAWTAFERLLRVGALFCLLAAAGCAPYSGPYEETDDDASEVSSVPSLPSGSLLSELNPIERSLFWRANEARRKAGGKPLRLRPELCRIARDRNAEMVQLGRITRFTREGLDIGQQLRKEGVIWNHCAINIARVPPYAPNIPQKAVDLWLKDPVDRKDLLFHLFDETGIAAQQDPKSGKWFITQIYARRSSYWLP